MNTRRSGELPRVLHIHPPLNEESALGTPAILKAFGQSLRHSIVLAGPSRGDSPDVRRARGLRGELVSGFPSLRGVPLPGRLQRIAKAMKPFDLVCTYNGGALDAAMAHTLFKDVHGLPALIHHEDGDEFLAPGKRAGRRTWYRRLALGRSAGLVVPSETLEEMALVDWQQPLGRVKRIAPGIDTAAFAMRPKRDALRVVKRPGELWVGARSGFDADANLPRLVRAFARLEDQWHLVIVGDGPGRDAVIAEADLQKVNHRVHLAGAHGDVARAIGLFDIYAMTADRAHVPIDVIEAMAAGLPIAATAVGDVAHLVAEENREFVIPVGKDDDLALALGRLASDRALRVRLGAANRARARAEFGREKAIAAYRRLYSSAMRREF